LNEHKSGEQNIGRYSQRKKKFEIGCEKTMSHSGQTNDT
jgi:hypothetical protein